MASWMDALLGAEQVPGERWEAGPFPWLMWVFVLGQIVWRALHAQSVPWLGVALIPFQLWCCFYFLHAAVLQPRAVREYFVTRLDLAVNLSMIALLLGAGYGHGQAGGILVVSVTFLALQTFSGRDQSTTSSRPAYHAIFAAFMFVEPAQSTHLMSVLGISLLIGICFGRANQCLRELRHVAGRH